jgi:hypothetical protein
MKTKRSVVRRAQVGWTGSHQDRDRLFSVMAWMVDNRRDGLKSKAKMADTKFDLIYEGEPTDEYGRDFLLDDRSFDVVILHWLFIGWDEMELPAERPTIAEHWAFSTSERHNPKAWRERLARCGAERIFIFGGSTEVHGSWIGSIPGYTRHYASFGVVYERNDLVPSQTPLPPQRRTFPTAPGMPR